MLAILAMTLKALLFVIKVHPTAYYGGRFLETRGCACPYGPCEARVIKFTIYVPLTPKMHTITTETGDAVFKMK